jgi:DNA-binding MarR family transcriptional regulator
MKLTLSYTETVLLVEGIVYFTLPDEEDRVDELEESRSMRLLQPRLRILMYVYKRGGVPDNISQLSSILGYVKDSWVNGMVNELIDGKYLQRTKLKGVPSITITPKGRQKIASLILPKWLALVIAVLSLIPMIWALDVELLHMPVALPAFLTVGIIMFLMSMYLFRSFEKLERSILDLKEDIHRNSE